MASTDRVAALLVELVAEVRGLRADMAQHRTTSSPDAADDDLLAAIMAGMGEGSTFRACDLMGRAKQDAAFKARLLAADIQSALDCGYWLRKYHGHVVNNRRLDVTDRDSDGAIWSFTVPM